jgi:hypothetical protein
MHLFDILRIITFSCLERHSNFNNSDFNSFRFFWDTLYRVSQKKLTPLLFIWISNVSVFFDSPCIVCLKKKWTFQIQIISYNVL